MAQKKRAKKAAPKHTTVKKKAKKMSISPRQLSFFAAIFAVFNAPVK